MGHFRNHYFPNKMINLRENRLPKGLDKIFLKSRKLRFFPERNSRIGIAALKPKTFRSRSSDFGH